MNHLKMLGVAVIAVALLGIGAGSASATVLTSPKGTVLPAGSEIDMSAESSLTLKMGFTNVTCTESTMRWKTGNAGSSTETVKGKLELLTFANCSGVTYVGLSNGSLEFHATSSGNGTLTSTGWEFTVNAFGTSCVYATNNTNLGTVTGSVATGSTATLDLKTTLKKVGGGFACAVEAPWEGSYVFTKPDYLALD